MPTLSQAGSKKTPALAFRIPAKLHQRIKIEAARRTMSIQQLCIEAIATYISPKAQQPKEHENHAA